MRSNDESYSVGSFLNQIALIKLKEEGGRHKLCYSAQHASKNEAGRLVVAHKIDPKTSTLHRKDEAHG